MSTNVPQEALYAVIGRPGSPLRTMLTIEWGMDPEPVMDGVIEAAEAFWEVNGDGMARDGPPITFRESARTIAEVCKVPKAGEAMLRIVELMRGWDDKHR